jgi:hypothetical protein
VALVDAQRVGLGLTAFISISVRNHSKTGQIIFQKLSRACHRFNQPLGLQTIKTILSKQGC